MITIKHARFTIAMVFYATSKQEPRRVRTRYVIKINSHDLYRKVYVTELRRFVIKIDPRDFKTKVFTYRTKLGPSK